MALIEPVNKQKPQISLKEQEQKRSKDGHHITFHHWPRPRDCGRQWKRAYPHFFRHVLPVSKSCRWKGVTAGTANKADNTGRFRHIFAAYIFPPWDAVFMSLIVTGWDTSANYDWDGDFWIWFVCCSLSLGTINLVRLWSFVFNRHYFLFAKSYELQTTNYYTLVVFP